MPEDEFIPVPKTVFCTDSVTGFDLYVQLAGRFILYRSGSLPFDVQTSERLQARHIETLYIRRKDRENLTRYVRANTPTIMRNATIPTDDKMHMLYGATTSALVDLFTDPTSGVALKATVEATAAIVDSVISDNRAFSALAKILQHDYNVYAHSVNVCAYAVALGHRASIPNGEELFSLGLGAVLHDIGKVRIDSEILYKNGPLSPLEWDIIRRHPIWGAEVLREVDIPELALGPVLDHHERVGGGGYPNGLVGDQISLFGRITKIADAYDAMTSPRAYRDAYSPFAALSTMRYRMIGHFDLELLTDFILMLGGVSAGEEERVSPALASVDSLLYAET